MATAPKARSKSCNVDRRFVLHGIRWKTYESLLRDLEPSNIRLTYNRGSLEIMSPGIPHEMDRSLISRLIESMTEVLNIPIRSGGSATLRRRLLKCGLEPDACYWIQNESRVRRRRDLDFEVDRPPDLCVEVESSRSALGRLGIYAGLRIPEVWRYDGRALRVAILEPHGSYRETDQSAAFPFLPVADIVRFLKLSETMDETSWIRSFRGWVRAEIAPRLAGSEHDRT